MLDPEQLTFAQWMWIVLAMVVAIMFACRCITLYYPDEPLTNDQVEAPAPTRATFGEFYFPGWEVAINGTPIDDDVLVAALNPNGQLQVDVPAGLSELDASYRGPPGGRSLALVSLLLLVAALGACRVRPLAQQS